MRILFSSYALYGHLIPMLPLARAAQRAGHEIMVATSGELASRIEQYGFPVWRLEEERQETAPIHGSNWIPGPPMEVSARLRAPQLVERAEAWKPHIIIHEPLEGAARIAAARTGAHCCVHALGPMVPVQMYGFMMLKLKELYSEWGLSNVVNEMKEQTYLDICPPSLQNKGVKLWKNIRPLRNISFEPSQGGSLPFAADSLPHRQTIHVTLGTVVNKAISIFQAVLAGLQDLAVNVVITVGPDVDPDELGPQPSNIIIKRFVPHGLLLPRCQLVINHGGNGSVFASLSHGIPLLLLPQGADQFNTAVACAKAGAALVLQPGETTAQAVNTAVKRLLAETAFSASARQLQLEIAGMPAPEQVVDSLIAAIAQQRN